LGTKRRNVETVLHSNPGIDGDIEHDNRRRKAQSEQGPGHQQDDGERINECQCDPKNAHEHGQTTVVPIQAVWGKDPRMVKGRTSKTNGIDKPYQE
jgi:hypothetical protein